MIWAFMRLSVAMSAGSCTTTRCVACWPMPLAAHSPVSTICSSFSGSTWRFSNFLQLRRVSSACTTSFMGSPFFLSACAIIAPTGGGGPGARK